MIHWNIIACIYLPVAILFPQVLLELFLYLAPKDTDCTCAQKSRAQASGIAFAAVFLLCSIVAATTLSVHASLFEHDETLAGGRPYCEQTWRDHKRQHRAYLRQRFHTKAWHAVPSELRGHEPPFSDVSAARPSGETGDLSSVSETARLVQPSRAK